MFVRWQRRRLKPGPDGRRITTASAVLVEAVRVDGKPRQRHVAYLGTVSDDDDTYQRAWWWQRCSARLDELGNRLSPEDRGRIEAALAAKMPPVTAKQIAAYDRQHRKAIAAFPDVEIPALEWPEGQAPRRLFASIRAAMRGR